MKKYLLIASFAFLIVGESLFAQATTAINSFKISNNKSPDKEELYKITIAKADMESFRLKEKNVVLKFAEGFECVLLSAHTLTNIGLSINLDDYSTDFPENFIMPSFSIAQNGTIIAGYKKVVTK